MVSRPPTERDAGTTRFAWASAAFATVIVGGFVVVLWAVVNGRTLDVAASPYHVPLYGGALALAVTCVAIAVRARRSGRDIRRALPPGFGLLGIGAATFVLALVLDVGWREGVGIRPGIEDGLAPSRIVITVALAMIAFAPLRAALVLGADRVPRVPILVSGALTMAAVAWPGGFHPAQSPWVAADPELPPAPADMWVMDADGGHQTRLVEAGEASSLGYASWAPDGRRIAYTRFAMPPAGAPATEASVWLVDADGADPSPLSTDDEWRWLPRLTPDGTSVLLTQEASGGPWMEEGPRGPGVGAGPQGPLTIPLPNADIWRVPGEDGGRAVRLTESAGDDRAPVPSPDGSLVLFDSTRDGNTELYVIGADGGNPRRLTNDPGEDWGASWSPDGTQIAFNSSRTGAMEIYVMDADGESVRQVTFDGEDNVSPSWSPDGSRLAFTARTLNDAAQIWSMKLDGTDRANLSRSPSSDDQVWTGGWGRDGRIAFTRALAPVAQALPIVRWDLGAAAMLLSAALIAGVVVLLTHTRPAPGAITLVLVLASALAAAPDGEWRFVGAGALAGVLADLAAGLSPTSLRGRAAGAAAAGGLVIGSGIVAAATTGLEWTPTLLLGVALAGSMLGWSLGAIAGIGVPRSPEPVP